MIRYVSSVFIAVLAAATLSGCSGMDESEPETRSVKKAVESAAGLSSQILDIIALRGKVSESTPGPDPCDGKDFEKYYRVYHAWSLHGVPVPDMERAMGRLRSELPKRGWKIIDYGPDSSKAKSLELTADHPKRKFSVVITLQDRRGRSKDPSMIEVDVNSSCFRVPEGQTVRGA